MPLARFTSLAALAVVCLAFSGAAKAECGDFPKVSWWKGLNHEEVARYVEANHGGEWSPYIQKWENQLAILMDVYGRGSTAIVKGTKLKDEELAVYIEKVGERVRITRCLAGQDGGEEIADLATAAGGKESTDLNGSEEETLFGAETSQCAPFPEISWRDSLTNETVALHVDADYSGDWKPYIAKWERHLDKARQAHQRELDIVFLDNGLRLSNEQLGGYVQKIDRRIAVTRCLADKDGAELKYSAL